MKRYFPAKLYATKMRSAFASLSDFHTCDTDFCDAVAPTASNMLLQLLLMVVLPAKGIQQQ
jgi:hypothetical protein